MATTNKSNIKREYESEVEKEPIPKRSQKKFVFLTNEDLNSQKSKILKDKDARLPRTEPTFTLQCLYNYYNIYGALTIFTSQVWNFSDNDLGFCYKEIHVVHHSVYAAAQKYAALSSAIFAWRS